MQNGKKLWYLTIYDVISAQKYDIISFKAKKNEINKWNR